MDRLRNKIAIVTGAGQGIGFATAKAFAEEGAVVWAVDIQSDGLDRLASHFPNIHKAKVDVTVRDEIQVLAKRTGPIDILFNCAGFVHSGSVLDCQESDLDFWTASTALPKTFTFEHSGNDTASPAFFVDLDAVSVSVPEPTTIVLLMAGGLVTVIQKRRK